MNGWLSQDGTFTPCEQFKHDEVAREKFGHCEKGMFRDKYIKVFSCFNSTDIVPTHFITDSQREWLHDHGIEE